MHFQDVKKKSYKIPKIWVLVMNFKLLFLLSISIICISCTTTQQASTTRVMDIYGSGVLQMPVVGELDVDINKVTGTATGNRTVNTENLKIIAINRAVKNADADLLIEPSFEISRNGTETTVIASGFPATYTSFRPATLDDIPLMEIGQLQKAAVFEASEGVQQEDQSTSRLFKAVAFLGGVSLAAYLVSQ